MSETERILVTGASRGIGRAIALDLAAPGRSLVLNYRSQHQEAEAVAELCLAHGADAVSLLPFDVANRLACTQALEADIAAHGPYHGLVLNAGITRDGTFAAMPQEDWSQVLQTNLDSFHHVLQPCLLPMVRRRKGGRIVTIASVSGLVGQRGQVNYSAAKGGLIAATKALATELASRSITVNCVAPGLIDTQMIADMAPEARAQALASIPMQRLGLPEEVAAAVAFLMSPRASYITRQVLSVNGGLV